MGFLQEFKEFASKGNVVDMAVGIIVGAAFNKIVNSLVQDIIMPPIGYLLGGVNFKDLKLIIKPAVVDATSGKETAVAVSINYGMFINTIVEFLIIAFSVFCVVKAMNKVVSGGLLPNPFRGGGAKPS
jgi:large conductance mechanosensitive channel